jgi:hypothetical protein
VVDAAPAVGAVEALVRMKSVLREAEVLDVPLAVVPAAPVVLPEPVLLALPAALADCRHPVMVTVCDESLADGAGRVPACPLVPAGAGSCAAAPTAIAALSIVPKMN